MSLFNVEFDQTPYVRVRENLKEVAFPLGGIGTGCVSLDGRGGLIDWEIFGRPNKGCVLDYTFPALWCMEQGRQGTRDQGGRALRVLGQRLKHWVGESSRFWDFGHGRMFTTMDGLPCFDSVTFTGTFPVARLRFEKAGLPIKVELAALNPFVPLDVPASSFP